MNRPARVTPLEIEETPASLSESLRLFRRAGQLFAESAKPALRSLLGRIAPSLAPASLALVYIWFGALKIIGSSPAAPLVTALQLETLPFFDPTAFLVLLGIAEVAIGIAFLSDRWRPLALVFFAGHMIATLLPLVALPNIAWQSPLTPTLEGQYIIKNVVLIALAVSVAAGLVADRDGTRAER